MKKITKALLLSILCLFAMFATAGAAAQQFEDVSLDDWYYDAVMEISSYYAVEAGGAFNPNEHVSQAEANALINCLLGESLTMVSTSSQATHIQVAEAISANITIDMPAISLRRISVSFNDVSGSDLQCVSLLSSAGIVRGAVDSQNQIMFYPNNEITRAELYAMVSRALALNSTPLVEDVI